MGGSDGSTEESRGDRDAAAGGYRWECPVCGASRVNTQSRQGKNALRALKTHVYLTDGNGHGEATSYPDDHPEDALVDYVGPEKT